MSEERKERCETCRFWHRDDEQNECRRNPPTFSLFQIAPEDFLDRKLINGDPVRESGLWPVTLESDWCGEYQPKLT